MKDQSHNGQLSQLSQENAQELLRSEGLRINAGPFSIRLKSDLKLISEHLLPLYRNFPLANADDFTDFDITLRTPAGLRRWIKPQVQFCFDSHLPFMPLPLNQAVPVFEWGLNWCIANYSHQYLQFHAAGLSHRNAMIIMPAPPGSGKSTLTAALMNHGWRLFSDEIVLIRPSDLNAIPIARPINLKNNSIDLMQQVFPNAYMTKAFKDTAKGTVALMAPSMESLSSRQQYRKPTHIIYPRYVSGHPLEVKSMNKSDACMELIRNSFNYHMMGEEGFRTAVEISRNCECLELRYSKLDDAFQFFDQLAS